MKKYSSLLLLILVAHCSFSQDESNELTLRTYVELYYGLNLGYLGTDQKNMPDFQFNHHRHNEFNLNLGLLNIAYENDRVRSSLGMMVGTYVYQNMIDEPDVLKNIYQASVGVKLSSSHNFWLDVGVHEAHTGFEGAIGKDQNFMTRSILAENSPYFSTGAVLSYISNNEALEIRLFVLNGWQNIVRDPLMKSPAVGHQVLYKPNEKWTFNSSSYIGEEVVDQQLRNRLFHNFHAIYDQESWNAILGVDYGAQHNFSSTWYTWQGIIAECRFNLFKGFRLGFRSEYFNDSNYAVIPIQSGEGFNNLGFTLGIDYAIKEEVLIRFETKYYAGEEDYYIRGNEWSNELWYIGAALCFDFSKKL